MIFNGIADFERWFIIWKVPLFKVKLNFENALEHRCEWWQISSKTLVCLEWGN